MVILVVIKFVLNTHSETKIPREQKLFALFLGLISQTNLTLVAVVAIFTAS